MMYKLQLSLLLSAMALMGATGSLAEGDIDSATTLYVNGDIVTMNTAQPGAEAVAVRDGKFLAVGSAAEVIAAAGKGAKTIDLEGRALLPGFIDSHGHFSMTSMYLAFENVAAPPVGPVENIADIQQILRVKQVSTPKGEWILGRGYDEAYLEEGRHPNRFDLDEVSRSNPIALIHVSGHFMTCNSKCLEIAGIDASTEDPEGGVIRRVDGSGEPNGLLEEQAMYKLLPHLPIHDVEKFLALIGPAQDYYASFGITTLQDGFSQKSDLQLFDLAAKQGLFKLDLIAYPSYKLSELLAGQYSPSMEYRNHWRVGGVKLGLDGSPQGKTAYLTKPYYVAPPGQGGDYRGYPIMQQDAVNRYLDMFYAKGWQTLVHANGDAAARQMIDAVALAAAKHGKGDRRTTMIHAQTVREDQLDRMRELQIIPSYFVSHTYFWGDWHRDSVLGPQRAARISPVKSTLERDMVYTLHNDAPVVPPDMLHLVWSAVNRVTRSEKVLGPQQRISVLDALKGITIHAAYQNFEEHIKGSIEPGKLADLVILSKNPLRVDPTTIKDIQVLETIKEGEQVYHAY
jgi:predicted amidohydrolase YtcJ